MNVYSTTIHLVYRQFVSEISVAVTWPYECRHQYSARYEAGKWASTQPVIYAPSHTIGVPVYIRSFVRRKVVGLLVGRWLSISLYDINPVR